MKIERLGSTTFQITTIGNLELMIDPWLSGNPTVNRQSISPDALKKIDVVLISHAHIDHVNGLKEIVRANQEVTIICHMELGSLLKGEGIERLERLNFGGKISIDDMSVTLVPAAHSSSYGVGPERVWAGPAAGMILDFKEGYRVYYAGDTGLMSDMKFVIGEYFKPDLALLPVGGHVTMDPEQAAFAAGEFIKPRHAIPFHYFPEPDKAPDPAGMLRFLDLYPIARPLVGDKGNEFKAVIEKRYPHVDVIVLNPGEAAETDKTGNIVKLREGK